MRIQLQTIQPTSITNLFDSIIHHLLPGNDLARVLRWGPGYTGGEDPLNLLRDVIDAEEIRLDRWTVVFHPEDKPEDAAQKAPPNATGKKKKVHQAQPSTQNQHQTAAITSNQTQGHLISKTTSCTHIHTCTITRTSYYMPSHKQRTLILSYGMLVRIIGRNMREIEREIAIER